jgi:hypothetical protein
MGIEAAPAPVRTLPVGRAFFADERGVMLRTTWHLDRGFLNMSIWQDTLCVATFQLHVTDAARLAGFLVEGLGDATATLLDERTPPVPAPAPPPAYVPGPAPGVGRALGDAARSVMSAAGAQLLSWSRRAR